MKIDPANMLFGCLFFEEACDVEGPKVVAQLADSHRAVFVRSPPRDVTRAPLALEGEKTNE